MSLSKYETYKSSGVEWLNEIPEHWDIQPLRRLISAPLINGIFKKKDEFGAGTPLINVFDIYRNDFWVNFETLDRVVCTTAEVGAYQVLAGDLFFVRSSLKAEGIAAVAIAGHCDEATVFECHLVRARPDPNRLYPRFASYLLNSTYHRSMMVANAKITTMTTIDQEAILSIPILVPRISEQHSIADFLDRETVRIDALIEQQRHLIELLKAKRQAAIAHAVTKGLAPRVPIKESGVAWLGDIPAHWEIKPLRRLISVPLTNGIFKKRDEFGTGTRLINVFDIYRHDFLVSFETLDRVACTREEIAAYQVLPGDLFFVRSSLKIDGIGAVAIAGRCDEATVFECHLIRARPQPKELCPRFASYLLNSTYYRSMMVANAKITTMTTIDQEAILSIPLLVPRLSEQRSIAAFLDRETAKIDALISEAKAATTLLEERRGALIFAAVTGKIDVRELIDADAPVSEAVAA